MLGASSAPNFDFPFICQSNDRCYFVDSREMHDGTEAIGMHTVREMVVSLPITGVLLFHVVDLSQDVPRCDVFSMLLKETGYPCGEGPHLDKLSDCCMVTSL